LSFLGFFKKRHSGHSERLPYRGFNLHFPDEK